MSNRIKGSKIRGYGIGNNSSDKSDVVKIKRNRVRRKSDKELEKEAVYEDNMSILVIVIIIVLCFIVGISLGICLYRLAINNSNSAIIINKFLLRN